jgi:iron complex transport system substrate-binding protein
MLRKMTFALLTLALLLTACAPAQTPMPTIEPIAAPTLVSSTATPEPTAVPTAAPLSFTDGLNRNVTLAGPAQSIVSLAPSNTEILFAVGAGKQVVGRDEFSDYPAEVKALPSVGGLTGQYNLEQLAALKPDLVLAAQINTAEQVKAIEGLGITVYYLNNPKTLEDLYANLDIVAKLTGHEKESTALIEALKARVAAVDEKIKGAAAKPVVFYELDASSDPSKPWTIGAGTFVSQLIERAGGVNLTIAAGITDAYPQVSIEQIVTTDPDLIILGDSMWGVTVESVGQRPGWAKLKAVTGGQVFPFDDNLVSRPSPRLVDGLEALAKLLHPELFK